MMRDDKKRGRLMRLAALASVSVGASLAALKAVVWIKTGSVTMLASLADSSLDLLASIITFVGIRTALEPPDHDHRFGHSKAEGLAALAQGAIMIASSVFLLQQSVLRLFDPQPVAMAWSGLAVSVLAIVLTLGLVLFQRSVIAKTGSLAVDADSLHYTGDLLLNLAVMVGIALSGYAGILWADGLFGALIGVFIGYNAFSVARRAVDMLMDKEMDDATREVIFNIVLGNSDVLGIHDLKTRKAGLREFIQFHIEVNPMASLRSAHLAATEVEAALSEHFPDAEFIIKIDPAGSGKPNKTVQELPQ
ncbi:iron transporter [Iodidimonas muriae]|uniref:Iron transporter n=1 Tax=Iodidimonas muriae TaxID=261467 RepID=A0ABQ2LDC1_9PROT|nr:cation diffusion facilitator family transporter [Iodidimonas muriae]GER08043.1 iron transporter [Kordiimonadales bacterium JCM 17843]GGO09052.1 iron transporter [Iodidimonas muriae]